MNSLLLVLLFVFQSLHSVLAADDSTVTDVITSTVQELVTILEYRFTTNGHLTTVYATGGTSTLPFPSATTQVTFSSSTAVPVESAAPANASTPLQVALSKTTGSPILVGAVNTTSYYSSSTSTYTEVVDGTSVAIEEVHLYLSQC